MARRLPLYGRGPDHVRRPASSSGPWRTRGFPGSARLCHAHLRATGLPEGPHRTDGPFCRSRCQQGDGLTVPIPCLPRLTGQLPVYRHMIGGLVEPRGIEPLTSWLPAKRAPSCAIPPQINYKRKYSFYCDFCKVFWRSFLYNIIFIY